MINTILLLGSSTIRRWKHFTLDFKNEIVYNKGISHLLTEDLITIDYLKFVNKNVKYMPKYIIFYCGINDILNDIDNKIIINNLLIFLEKLCFVFNKSKIIVLSIIKSPLIYKEKKIQDVDYINNKLRNFCNKNGEIFNFININKELNTTKNIYFVDDLHINDLGYEKITQKIQEKI